MHLLSTRAAPHADVCGDVAPEGAPTNTMPQPMTVQDGGHVIRCLPRGSAVKNMDKKKREKGTEKELDVRRGSRGGI